MNSQDDRIQRLEQELHDLEESQSLECSRKKFWNVIKLVARSAIMLSLALGIYGVTPRVNMSIACIATLAIMWIDYELHFVKK